jgi:hypothetical protein
VGWPGAQDRALRCLPVPPPADSLAFWAAAASGRRGRGDCRRSAAAPALPGWLRDRHPSHLALKPAARPPAAVRARPCRCEALYDRLMELDDVDAVYSNAGGGVWVVVLEGGGGGSGLGLRLGCGAWPGVKELDGKGTVHTDGVRARKDGHRVQTDAKDWRRHCVPGSRLPRTLPAARPHPPPPAPALPPQRASPTDCSKLQAVVFVGPWRSPRATDFGLQRCRKPAAPGVRGLARCRPRHGAATGAAYRPAAALPPAPPVRPLLDCYPACGPYVPTGRTRARFGVARRSRPRCA